ncbi:MAG: hypothetical protein GY704_05535 [Phycisphaeraceae bacterium]|nr:hypothetical protein [Phycisphaeraceae bacterium]
MPAFPAVGLLAARWIVRQQEEAGPDRGWRAWTLPSSIILGVAGLGGCVAFLAVPLIPEGAPEIPGVLWRGLAFGIPTLVLSALAIRAAWRGRPGAWAGFQAAAFVGATTIAALLVFPVLDDMKCARRIGAVLAARPERPTAIPCFGVSPEAFRFYSGRPTIKARLGDAWDREGREFLALISMKRRKDLPRRVRDGMIVLHEERLGKRTVLLLGR